MAKTEVQINLKITKEMYSALNEIATQECNSMQGICRKYLRDGINARNKVGV